MTRQTSLDSHLAFHLNAGVDYVVATDHRSQDGTTEILDRYARDGRLHLIREEDVEYREGAAPGWRRSSRPSWRGLGHPQRRRRVLVAARSDLKEVLAAIPAGYGLMRALWRPSLRPEGDPLFAERMTRAALRTGGDQRPSEPVSPECESDTSA